MFIWAEELNWLFSSPKSRAKTSVMKSNRTFEGCFQQRGKYGESYCLAARCKHKHFFTSPSLHKWRGGSRGEAALAPYIMEHLQQEAPVRAHAATSSWTFGTLLP